jgi:adenosylcobinamide-GDP ribazoletransferase
MNNPLYRPEPASVTETLAGWWRELRTAAAFLTILPVAPPPPPADAGAKVVAPERESRPPSDTWIEPEPSEGDDQVCDEMEREAHREAGSIAKASRFFPVVGAGIGLAAGLALLVADGLGLPMLAAAVIAIAVAVVLSGGLHEDGTADFVDGLAFGHDREQRLAIMRDSRIGSFGTLALIFAIGLRVALVAGTDSAGEGAAALIGAAAFSRAMLTPLMWRLEPARAEGMAFAAGRPERSQMVTALALAAVILLFSVGVGAAVAALIVGGMAVAAVGWLAQRALGGQTGDVLGCGQQVAEMAALAAVVAVS